MVNHETNELFFDNLEIPAENLIGEEGQGLQVHPRRPQRRAHADRRRVHRRRLLVHRQGHAIRQASAIVFGRPIGQNQGVQFPIAEALHRGRGGQPDALQGLRAVRRAPAVRRRGQHGEATSPPRRRGRPPTPACSSTAASASPREYDVERKFRETRLYQVAPISTNLILSLRRRARARPAAIVLSIMMRPLEGITVVTLEHAIAAPFCTRQLADLGARVIKVERPGSGDFARGYDERVHGLASHFVWTNRSKESLTLDVKHAEAQRGPGAACRRRRRAGAEPRARRCRAPRAVVTRRCATRSSAPDRLRHLRLRRDPTARIATRRPTTC